MVMRPTSEAHLEDRKLSSQIKEEHYAGSRAAETLIAILTGLLTTEVLDSLRFSSCCIYESSICLDLVIQSHRTL